jgi:hypothetical protein
MRIVEFPVNEKGDMSIGLYPEVRCQSIALHPRWSGQAGRASALRDFLEYALEKGEVWFARRIDIASWWLDRHDEFRP